ncbi:beta-glucan synthesis-associated [Exidia glandulosa HHB12029]|uniref:Beta-glucan synthesis-associated n=1 Tax=Exidia glandulosa HHB12029 TaxID=1314781 RepID=A0A165KZA2_EXIGL|nr:beta-glucan synthesis-associated [Exidia glandulosa HHB12029]
MAGRRPRVGPPTPSSSSSHALLVSPVSPSWPSEAPLRPPGSDLSHDGSRAPAALRNRPSQGRRTFTNTPGRSLRTASEDDHLLGATRFSVASSLASVPYVADENKSQGSQRGPLLSYRLDPFTDRNLNGDDDDLDRKAAQQTYSGLNLRGFANVAVLVILIVGIVALFAGYPIADFILSGGLAAAIANNVHVNGTGQAAVLANIPKLIDPDTPDDKKTRTGYDGFEYDLVFSDEFNVDGRTFYPGDDPFWEAVDIWYGATKDLEWYDPSQVTTSDGKLHIKIEQVDPTINHNLTLKSGMLQSWNKFCFTNGYIEVLAQFPGAPNVAGYWPGAWTMGNLGRPGYGASTDGVWPYTYDSCDIGILRNQSRDGVNPVEAFNLPLDQGGRPEWNYDLSWLPGQRASACTCEGEDHPGPINKRGRGAPELDILEAEKDKHGRDGGSISQSSQYAPFNINYRYDESQVEIFTPEKTQMNTYRGSPVQQAVSGLSETSDAIYGGPGGGGQFGIFGFEYFSDLDNPDASFVSWIAEGERTHTMHGAAVGADPVAQIGRRFVSREPMSIILNLGVSKSFQQNLVIEEMTFPAEFVIDYVRVYQRKGSDPDIHIGCDPPDYPTSKYIADHLNAYMNPNLTSWAGAGYTFPKNTMLDNCT